MAEYLTPLSAQLRQQNIASETNQGNQNQAIESGQAGAAISSGIRSGLKQHDDDAKAREFEKILSTGVEGMKAAKEAFIKAGYDGSLLPDENLYSKDPSQIESYYKLMIGEKEKQDKKKRLKTIADKVGTEDYEGVVSEAIAGGDTEPTTGIKNLVELKETKAVKEADNAFQALISSDDFLQAQDDLTTAKNSNEAKAAKNKIINRLYKDDVNKSKLAQKYIDDLQKSGDDLESIKAAYLGLKETDLATKFVKNTQDYADELTMFSKLDKDIPGGIYNTGGISGFGFGTKPLRSLWKTDEAKKIRPTLQTLINTILKRRSGAAVTESEWDRLETEFGINTTGTVEEFRLGLQNYYETSTNTYNRYSKADPKSAAKFSKPTPLKGSPFEKSGESENINISDVSKTNPKKVKLSAIDRNNLLEKMSDKQLDDYNAGIIDIYGNKK